MLDKASFIRLAKEAGFSEIGFCMPYSFEHARQIVASQEPLAERRQLRFAPQEDLPEARSLAILLWPYAPAQEKGEGVVFVDSYYRASNAAYHAARKLETKLLDAGCFAKANVSYPAKEAALRAGMGIIGQNSLLITPDYGSRIVIILMATDIEIDPSQSDLEIQPCLKCGNCAKACPSGAIDENGMSHPERCLRNFMMEGVMIPETLREKIGMRLIGCDICQRVCPLQKTEPQQSAPSYLLQDFITSDLAAFSAAVSRLAEEIGRNSARPQRVRAQAALLAGNAKDPSFLPVLHQWAEMPFEAVREHALWAIEQIRLSGDKA